MKIISLLLIFPIRVYQLFLSPLKLFFFGPYCCCRFSPTCSQFAVRALQKYSCFQALYFIARRLAKCHPFYQKFS
ncbi:MAG: membrane protein insertion efficiency factor YidD [Puniceicoccales bacterium]|nr:membrane protein insertion efficiency factor YidD [Puniceicoccales bacterium]